jgi:hypothetical protein
VRGRIVHNKFDGLDFRAIEEWGGGMIFEDLSDNDFSNVTQNRRGFFRGFAIAVDLHGAFGEPAFPFIERARNNRFYRCDLGLHFAYSAPFSAAWSVGDFGTEAEPGKNVFHCNGPAAGNGGLGSILFDLDDVPAPVYFDSFQGNLWDRNPELVTSTVDFYTRPWPPGDVYRRSDKITWNVKGAELTPGGSSDCP